MLDSACFWLAQIAFFVWPTNSFSEIQALRTTWYAPFRKLHFACLQITLMLCLLLLSTNVSFAAMNACRCELNLSLIRKALIRGRTDHFTYLLQFPIQFTCAPLLVTWFFQFNFQFHLVS